MPRGIQSVAVVGAGFMGSGIAESVAVAGIPVVVRDVDEVSIKRAASRLDTSLARAVQGGKLEPTQAEAARERLELRTDLEAIGAADLVIEAVPEQARLKLAVRYEIDATVRQDTIIASNTSSIRLRSLPRRFTLPSASWVCTSSRRCR